MSTRHLARSIVLQTLFEWDFNSASEKSARDPHEVLSRNAEEFAPGIDDFSFMENLLKTVLAKQESIDAIIEKAAPEWPIDKISTIDRNVLRLGLAELLFSDRSEVPPKVAINEAIELAKSFSGDTGGRFVNGVLGAVYRELGEPGKEEKSKRKDDAADPSKLPLVELAGAVVYSRDKAGAMRLALVHDVFGRWTLTKGTVKEGEDAADAAVRKASEEMGATAEIQDKIGNNEYIASVPDEGKVRKRVTYFLAEAPYRELTVEENGGLDDAKWFELAEIPDLNMYDDILPIVTKGIKMMTQKA